MKRIMALNGIRTCAAVVLLAFVFLNTKSGTQAQTPVGEQRLVAASSQITWHSDLRSGWAEAKSRNVPMVVFVTSDRCHYCDAMKRDTWASATVAGRIASRFVAIELTPDRNAQALAHIDVPAYPTTLVALADGKVVAQRVGYQGVTELLGLLAQAESDRAQ